MFKKILLLIAVLLPMSAFAQKFGVVDIQAVFTAMPETTAMQTQLQNSSKQFEDEFKKLTAEVEKLYAEYQTIEQDANTPQTIKDRRMQEIQERYSKMEQFRQSAEQDLARQQQQLMEPINAKVLDAIKAVGQEGSYTLILPREEGLLLYMGNDVVDVTSNVKVKLGL